MISATHLMELRDSSGIDQGVIDERGYRTVLDANDPELKDWGILTNAKQSLPGLLLPVFRVTGEQISAQFKPLKPITINGRGVKYLSPKGRSNHLDLHPRNQAVIKDSSVTLWITEGIKKGDSLTSRGRCVVTLMGVFNWRNKLGTLGDWEDVPLKGRDVVLCFDADARHNMNVARAMVRLGRWCKSKGAKRVRYLIVPAEWDGHQTKGVDDFFVAGGTIDVLEAAATTAEPDTDTADDTFSDARLAETVADEVLIDRFAWCKALGWLRWTGQRWSEATEEAVGEMVRRFTLRCFKQAVDSGKKAAIHGWQSMLGASRLRAVLSLTKGIVERTAEVFDADPELLNTPGGVVDLRTGQVYPHDPDWLMTKITSGSYRPGFEHSDWNQAMNALPDDGDRAWLQVRIGQAITGHPTPDGVVLVLQGSGENGKSALTTDGILPALGDYAAPASTKLIAASKGEHSTERADLRGQRFLIAEELTEDRVLDMTGIKRITDVGSIRARKVFRDNMTFDASHSLFITTNHRPIVHETDHGTWRRLALVVFPFTFRKAGESVVAATDRRGDAGLKQRIRANASGQHDAIVTWAVDGARAFYATGFPSLPSSVRLNTEDWRRETDRILGFWHEGLVADPGSCIVTSTLLSEFNSWMRANGHHDWSKELFHARFKGHDETVRHHVEDGRTADPDKLKGLSWPSGGPRQQTPNRCYVYVGVRFRAPDEVAENTEEKRPVPEVPDLLTTYPEVTDCHRVREESGSMGSNCCEGGPLKLRCKLCPSSSTYWRSSKDYVPERG